MAELGIDEVRKVARLARLELSAEELADLVGELSALLDHVDAIRQIDLSGVPPTAHALPLVNVLREDVPRSCLDRDEVLAAAPETEEGRFVVPSILGDEP
ncbi:MAG TPA: Asp-tRNA(Asn)/Glu-tRNA(Gln) amidotransferase subunit GatC [Acidimicrobiales bacterium]|nr:Asp-tRNA(Asn)/Glu-tRNA(Gln) amidotransferase subunit GatC [Acidimicrobiales bacterium]